ncbi:MAG: YabP/YqfC family sporulation protein [Lachnospiraceae bacterium]|nr:YabP/YqfC family sporulation protein [Lachnospiraceae bacterium]
MKNKNENKFLEKKEQIADLFSLPHDIVCGASNVSIIGSMRVIIENYKGILEYNSDKILLQGKQSKIQITGNCLKVRSYNEEEMVIDGRIDGVLFIK